MQGRTPQFQREWLITDGSGGFALGTPEGLRTRKYHGLLNEVAGRGQCVLLADLELRWNGRDLWPHRYAVGQSSGVLHPAPSARFRREALGVSWTWERDGDALTLRLEHQPDEGWRLEFAVRGSLGSSRAHRLEVRPLFAFRDLHGVGGRDWRAVPGPGGLRVSEAAGAAPALEIAWTGDWRWEPVDDWYRDFLFSEEMARGYDARESLRTAGVAVLEGPAPAGSWRLIRAAGAARRYGGVPKGEPALVYALDDPPGVLAGFPWFGEWGRDTFVSLPGIALAWCRLDEAAAGGWSSRLLERWSRWIEREDMLPNFLGPAGSTHWESADATLWFTHAVAALWSYGERLPALRASAEAALPAVEAAVRGIVAGRHRYLRVEGDGLVSVTGDRTTWMDANVDGAAVTPRNGRLPEINALWAQAHVLLALAGGRGAPAARRLADLALEVREAEPRPHRVFLGSLPLAPGWRRGGAPFLAAELAALSAAGLSTPVGPRTLAAGAPDYRGRYEGDQRARDRAYHRGAVWPWVSAHWAMTAQRAGGEWVGAARAAWEELRRRAPIEDQLPEMCEGDPPHAPVGAPAQAWSVAAWEEWRWREVNAGFDRAWQDVSSRRPRRNA